LNERSRKSASAPTDWADVADWYDRVVGRDGSEFQQRVIFPGVLKLLGSLAGQRVLDVACGQGALCRLLFERGATTFGIDSAQPLVSAARRHGPVGIRYDRVDARHLHRWTPRLDVAPRSIATPSVVSISSSVRSDRLPPDPIPPDTGRFHQATCILALQNIDPIGPVMSGVARQLAWSGRWVVVIMHPCFRSPASTSWGWDDLLQVQYRRVDRYKKPRRHPIVTHPGRKDGAYTWTFHRPLESYLKAGREAGFVVDLIEEWTSHKTSEPGPRAGPENLARDEIPMFMAMRFVKMPVSDPTD
jgi:SAM-dependent methyltransferase